jgi:hypothetical protein
MRLSQHLIVGVVALLVAACSGKKSGEALVAKAIPTWERDILADPDKLEFLTLHPDPEVKDDNGKYVVIGRFNKYAVLGRVEVKEKSLQRKFVDQLYQAIAEGDDGVGAACFDPRHAIHAEKDGKHVDVLVCFDCDNFYVFPEGNRNGVRLAAHHMDAWRAAPKTLNLPLHDGPAHN